MKLAVDHHYSARIVNRLRQNGHDVVAAAERGWHTEDDDALLALCQGERRALLTNNVVDLVVIARRWASEGRSHAGLVLTSDSSMPRSRQTIGRYLRALDALMRSLPADNALNDQIRWL